MRVVELRPDEPAAQQWYAVTVAAAVDAMGERAVPWSWADVVERTRSPHHDVVLLAAVDDDRVVGAAEMVLPLADNPRLAHLDLCVHPAARRRGVGTALLAEAEQRAAAADREVVETFSTVPPGVPDPAVAFCAARGYRVVLTELHSDLDLPEGTDVDALLAPLDADTAGLTGYRLETWWDAVPDHWVTQQALLHTRMSTDAPLGASALTEEHWDDDRVRASVALGRAGGKRMIQVSAVHEASGTLAGWTRMRVDPVQPDDAEQDATLVLREHRGHRLGMAMKAAALRALVAEVPGVRRVSTWNADVNAPMLRVNRAMGFVTVGVDTQWRKDL